MMWVTGAAGFIGMQLSRSLIAAGHTVCGLGMRRGGAQGDDPAWHDFAEGLIDNDALSALANRVGAPDVIFHLAGGGAVGPSLAEPYMDFARSVISTAQVLEWARVNAPAARIIHTSSAAVYGGGHDGPIAEDAVPNPFSPYGAHKLAAEVLCRSAHVNFGQDTVVVRPFSIFGAQLRKQLLWDSCNRMTASPDRLEFSGTGNEMRDWLPVGHLCDILAGLADERRSPPRVVNAGTGQGTSVRQIVTWLAQGMGLDDMEIAFSGVSRPGDPRALVANCTSLHSFMTAPPVDLPAEIAAYVRWFTAQAAR